MYFSYVPSIIFSFFNRPLFLNLLFKQILTQYYSFVSLVSTQLRGWPPCGRRLEVAAELLKPYRPGLQKFEVHVSVPKFAELQGY